MLGPIQKKTVNPQPSGRVRRSAFYVLVAACLLALCAAAAVMAEGDFYVQETRSDGETVLTVGNRFYEVSISPSQGGAITGFKLKPGGIESTSPGREDFGGLLQEVHTAAFPYEIVAREIDDSAADITLAASGANYGVEKRFSFRAQSPLIQVRLAFDNRTEIPRRGDHAPALANTFHWGGSGHNAGGYYYCIGRPHGGEKYTGRRALHLLHPLMDQESAELSWVAVIDPIFRAGIGIFFPDSGVQGVFAGRNIEGHAELETRMAAIPAQSRLVSDLMLVPLRGFSSVDLISPEMVAETLHHGFSGHRQVMLRIMSLMPGEMDISVVTRAYDAEGREIGLLETLVFDDVQCAELRTGTIDLWEDELNDIAWLRHVIYSGGVRLQQYSVRLAGSSPAPGTRPRAPEPPVVERLTDGRGDESPPGTVQDADKALRVSQLSGPAWEAAADMEVSLPANSSHTLFLRVDASEDMQGLQVGLVGARPDDAGAGVRALTAASMFLWEVIEPDSAAAELRPFRKQDITPDRPVVFAVTLSSRRLSEGVYTAGIMVSTETETLALPLTARVYQVGLAPSEGFALWYIGGDAMEVSGPAFEMLSRHSADAAGFAVSGRSDPAFLRSLQARAAENNMGMLGYYSPGMAAAGAERIRSAVVGPDESRSGAAAVWILCAGADGVEAAESVSALGYVPAAFVSRLSPARALELSGAGHFEHFLFGGDICAEAAQRAERDEFPAADVRLWRYVDLSPYHWRELPVRAREEFLGALAGGASGAAVRTMAPGGVAGGPLLFWHMLRDIREEAALVALASMLVHEPQVPESLRNRFNDLFSDSGDAPMRVVTERGAFRETLRVRVTADGAQPSGRRLRHLALEIIAASRR